MSFENMEQNIPIINPIGFQEIGYNFIRNVKMNRI